MSDKIYTKTPDEVLESQSVDAESGLGRKAVRSRREEFGRNQLRESQQRSAWAILLEQFQSVVILLLAFAAVVAGATQRWPEMVAIIIVIVVNTMIGFATEWKAVQSMEALRESSEHDCRVRREGSETSVSASEVVPGDILLVSPGEVVSADGRLVTVDGLKIDESALTGESVPVSKRPEALEESTPLAERTCMVYKGTTVADGEAVAVVTATGSDTELGKIADLAAEAESSQTPLQKHLDELGSRLAWITVGIAGLVAGAGWWAGQDLQLMAETAIALGIAAIPEGLPVVATMALARGMYLMAKRQAVVNKLPAVETLGATRIIFTDKTGTLTENEMKLDTLLTSAGKFHTGNGATPENLTKRLLEVATLCSNADLSGEDDPSGDPEEIALLKACPEYVGEKNRLEESKPRLDEAPFRHETMKMATLHKGGLVAVKGAPEAVFESCSRVVTEESSQEFGTEQKEKWQNQVEELARSGLRILAVAEGEFQGDSFQEKDPYKDLSLLGLVGFVDPPREGTKETIDSCQAAGITVEMITGDQPATALAVAEAVGIVGDEGDPEAVVMKGSELQDVDSLDEETKEQAFRSNIFARVEPEQKLGLVKLYQEKGEVVAMTGDGINDAPALKKADIGVAMGVRGTEAAKQVADMVLKDDKLETMVAAIKQGRVIFDNIRKAVMFMLCTNVAEVTAVAVASFLGWTLPLLPLQILYLNLLTDVFPALALGVGPGREGIMDEPSRDPDESVLTRSHWMEIGGWSVLIAGCVLGALKLSQNWLGLDDAAAITIAFLTIATSKLWFTFVLRDPSSPVFVNEVTRNKWVWAAIVFCIGLLAATVTVPFLKDLLQTVMPTGQGWLIILVGSLIPLLVGQVVRAVQRRRKDNS